MRLINTATLALQEFHEGQIPPYAILSHTWGAEEVTCQELEKPSSKTRAGYLKIANCCNLALSDGWEYVWIDTCCIDKTSSAELSEAINSMYRWYQNAEVCYAFLVDVTGRDPAGFVKSRWFTRGWTLQELLAPENVLFYDSGWEEIGTKLSLHEHVSAVTGVRGQYLANPAGASVAARMSWAADRKTTRVEDIAYSLMGLFDVNMPLLYGEGHKAFTRLQQAILAQTNDESLFAWADNTLTTSGLFAHSPNAYATFGDVVPVTHPHTHRRPSTMTNQGLEIDIHSVNLSLFLEFYAWNPTGQYPVDNVILLNCARERDGERRNPFFIPLRQKTAESYVRWSPNILPQWSLNKYGQAARVGPNVLESKREYVEMEYAFVNSGNQYQQMPCFFIALSPSEHAFSLIGEDQIGFTAWQSHKVNAQPGLGRWDTTRHGTRMLLLFKNEDGEAFILELIRSEKSPKIKIFVPSHEVINSDAMETYFSLTAGTDRALRRLQANSQVSVGIRKKFEGGFYYLIRIIPSPAAASSATSTLDSDGRQSSIYFVDDERVQKATADMNVSVR